MANVTIRRAGYALGAEVSGVDASKSLDDDTIAAIRKAIVDHIVVYLPGQDLEPAELAAFVQRFGTIDQFNTKHLRRHPEVPDIVVRASAPIVIDGRPVKRAPAVGDDWHSDYSYSRFPASMSFLLNKEVPSIGGDTMFANMYMAYETLSPAFKAMIEPLYAVHDFTKGPGYAAVGPAEQEQLRKVKPPTSHPVVRTHPESGRKALFINHFVRNFDGMTEEETRPLLYFLIHHAIRYEFLYRHRWTKHDLVIWDNRCSLHFAVQDYPAELRVMLRCSLVDAAPADLRAGELALAETAV